MTPQYDFDTIIVGGGPGGATAGALLAKAGQKVLVLEKETFPRFHIGESLLPFGNDVLKASGAWDKVTAAGFIPKFGAEFCVGNTSKFQRFWFTKSLTPEHGQTFQVERSKFDEILLRHAAECGCEVREGCAAKGVEFDADGVTVATTTQSLRARWFIDASGRDTFLGRVRQLPRENLPIAKRIAVYAHFTGVFRNEGEAAGHITITRLKDGWFWFIPLDAQKTSVGMVRTLDDLKQSGGEVSQWFERTVAGSTDLSNRIQNATRVSQFYTTSDYTYRYETLAMPRALMVGDAGGFIDPIFSSGVFVALRSAQVAVETLLRADATGRGLAARGQRRYTDAVHRMMDVYLQLITMFYDNVAFEVFMHPVNRFNMLRTIASVLGGSTERSFGMWWRMQSFYLICRIQRRFPLVPRVDFADRPAAQAIHT